MKKIIILASALLFGASFTQAQGNGNGNGNPGGPTSSWKLIGNSGTSPTTDYIGTSDNQPLLFKTNAIEWMRLSANGRLGLGTTNPLATFDLMGSFRFADGSQQAGHFLTTDANGNATWSALPTVTDAWSLNGTNTFYSGGNVGIGTSNPTTKLEIAGRTTINGGSTGETRLSFNYLDQGAMQFYWDESPHLFQMVASRAGGAGINFKVRDGANVYHNALTMRNNGNVGVGLFTPTANFHVLGTTRLQDGTESAGYVLTSDNAGNATWQDPASLVMGSETNPYGDLYVSNYLKVGNNSIHMGSPSTTNDNQLFTTTGPLVINSSFIPITDFITGGIAASSVGSNTVINPTLGQVGIGTGSTIPDAKLEVFLSSNYMKNNNNGVKINYDALGLGALPAINENIFVVNESNAATPDFIVKRFDPTPTTPTITNVGVGVAVPDQKMHIRGNLLVDGDQSSILLSGVPGSTLPDNAKGQWGIEYNDGNKGLNFWKPWMSTNLDGVNGFQNFLLFMNDDGIIGMGVHPDKLLPINNIDNYRLHVADGIRTTKIKVQLQAEWADYVFEEDYQLKSLDEVESFIEENGHLPNVPSAQEIEADGYELGQMDTKIMEKVEELTLYMIQLKKENEKLKQRVEELELTNK